MPDPRETLRALAALAVLTAALVACSRPTPLPPGGVVPPGPVFTPGSDDEQIPPGPIGVEEPPPGDYPPPYVGAPPPNPYPAPEQTETAEAGES